MRPKSHATINSIDQMVELGNRRRPTREYRETERTRSVFLVDRLPALRAAQDPPISASKLALCIGLGRHGMARWETTDPRHQRPVPFKWVQPIAEGLGVTVHALLHDTGQERAYRAWVWAYAEGASQDWTGWCSAEQDVPWTPSPPPDDPPRPAWADLWPKVWEFWMDGRKVGHVVQGEYRIYRTPSPAPVPPPAPVPGRPSDAPPVRVVQRAKVTGSYRVGSLIDAAQISA
jgi:hypothetical protein